MIERHNLVILNDNTPTYNRSKNILDLSICSNQLYKYFDSFKVLPDEISDHQPTITCLSHLEVRQREFQKN